MIHAPFARKDQLDKLVQHKVRPSFYTLHTCYFAEAHGANRLESAIYAAQPALAADAPLAARR
jgi:predicted amidohydrolase YtcJ